jgi:hypothetical protein
MRKLLAVALLALSLGAVAQPTQHPQIGKADFTVFKVYPNFAILFDPASGHGDPSTGDAVMTIKLSLKTPDSSLNSKYPIKSLINTVFIECEKDQLTVLVSQLYDAEDDLVGLRRFYEAIPNPHGEGQPTTEVLDFACAANPKYPNKRNTPIIVTPEDDRGSV